MGWIRIDRGIRDHQIWNERPFSKGQAWIDLLLRASWEKKKIVIGNQLVEIQPGEFVTSDRKLMEAWGWGKEKTRKYLKMLKSDLMIDLKPDRRWTVITIVNWDKYQIPQTDNRPTTDRKQTAVRPQSDPIKNINKENKYINNINNGYDYTSSLTVGGRQLEQPTVDQYHEIVDEWNKIPWTINIQEIIPGTKREDEVRVVIGMYGYEGLKGAIQSVKDSDYLHRLGHIKFDNYINRNVVQKLLEGSYQEDYKKGEETDGYDWCFSSTQYDSDPLPGIPAAHFR